MAKVTVKTEKVPVTTYESQETYVLELSKEEARAVYALVGDIIGSPRTSPRKFTNEVYNALNEAGLPPYFSDPFTAALSVSPEFEDNTLSEDEKNI